MIGALLPPRGSARDSKVAAQLQGLSSTWWSRMVSVAVETAQVLKGSGWELSEKAGEGVVPARTPEAAVQLQPSLLVPQLHICKVR